MGKQAYGHQYYLSTRTQAWTLSVKPQLLNAPSTSRAAASHCKGQCARTHRCIRTGKPKWSGQPMPTFLSGGHQVNTLSCVLHAAPERQPVFRLQNWSLVWWIKWAETLAHRSWTAAALQSVTLPKFWFISGNVTIRGQVNIQFIIKCLNDKAVHWPEWHNIEVSSELAVGSQTTSATGFHHQSQNKSETVNRREKNLL